MGVGADRGVAQVPITGKVRDTYDYINDTADDLAGRIAYSGVANTPMQLGDAGRDFTVNFPAGVFSVAPLVQLTIAEIGSAGAFVVAIKALSASAMTITVRPSAGGTLGAAHAAVQVHWSAQRVGA